MSFLDAHLLTRHDELLDELRANDIMLGKVYNRECRHLSSNFQQRLNTALVVLLIDEVILFRVAANHHTGTSTNAS